MCLFLLSILGLNAVHRPELGWRWSRWRSLMVVIWCFVYCLIIYSTLRIMIKFELSYIATCYSVASLHQFMYPTFVAICLLKNARKTIDYFNEQEKTISKFPRVIPTGSHKAGCAILLLTSILVTISYNITSVGRCILAVCFLLTPIVLDYFILCITAPVIHLTERITQRIQKLIIKTDEEEQPHIDTVPIGLSSKTFCERLQPKTTRVRGGGRGREGVGNCNNSKKILRILFEIKQARRLTTKYNEVN